jgi:hypothetical protein
MHKILLCILGILAFYRHWKVLTEKSKLLWLKREKCMPLINHNGLSGLPDKVNRLYKRQQHYEDNEYVTIKF